MSCCLNSPQSVSLMPYTFKNVSVYTSKIVFLRASIRSLFDRRRQQQSVENLLGTMPDGSSSNTPITRGMGGNFLFCEENCATDIIYCAFSLCPSPCGHLPMQPSQSWACALDGDKLFIVLVFVDDLIQVGDANDDAVKFQKELDLYFPYNSRKYLTCFLPIVVCDRGRAHKTT